MEPQLGGFSSGHICVFKIVTYGKYRDEWGGALLGPLSIRKASQKYSLGSPEKFLMVNKSKISLKTSWIISEISSEYPLIYPLNILWNILWISVEISLKIILWNILPPLLISGGAITHESAPQAESEINLMLGWDGAAVWRWIKEAQIYTLICICIVLFSIVFVLGSKKRKFILLFVFAFPTCSPTNQSRGMSVMYPGPVMYGPGLRGVWGAKWSVMCVVAIFKYFSVTLTS